MLSDTFYWLPGFAGHVTEDGKDDESRKKTGGTVNATAFRLNGVAIADWSEVDGGGGGGGGGGSCYHSPGPPLYYLNPFLGSP